MENIMSAMNPTEQLEQLVKARQLILANLIARFLAFPDNIQNQASMDVGIEATHVQVGDRSLPVLCATFQWDTDSSFEEGDLDAAVMGEHLIELSAEDDLDPDELEQLQFFMNELEKYAEAELEVERTKAALKQRLRENFTEEELRMLDIKPPKD